MSTAIIQEEVAEIIEHDFWGVLCRKPENVQMRDDADFPLLMALRDEFIALKRDVERMVKLNPAFEQKYRSDFNEAMNTMNRRAAKIAYVVLR